MGKRIMYELGRGVIQEKWVNSVMIKRFRHPNEQELIYSAKLHAAAIFLTLIVALIRLLVG